MPGSRSRKRKSQQSHRFPLRLLTGPQGTREGVVRGQEQVAGVGVGENRRAQKGNQTFGREQHTVASDYTKCSWGSFIKSSGPGSRSEVERGSRCPGDTSHFSWSPILFPSRFTQRPPGSPTDLPLGPYARVFLLVMK